MKSKIAIAALLLLPLSGQYAMAEEAAIEEKPALTVSAELGFLYKTGNTKSGDVKVGLNLKHEKDQWLNMLAFNALAKKLETEDENGEDVYESTDNKWDILGQTNYSLEEGGKNYLYGSAFYQQNKFNSFEYQSSASVGWGRHWWETETSSFFADIGPGVKYDVIRAVPATDTDPAIAKVSTLYSGNILINSYPDIHVRGWDIATGFSTEDINITTSTAFGSDNYFHYMASDIPNSGSTYSIPITTSSIIPQSTLPTEPINHKYMSGIYEKSELQKRELCRSSPWVSS